MLGTIVFVEEPRSKAEQGAFLGHACASLPTVGHRGSRSPTRSVLLLALPDAWVQTLMSHFSDYHLSWDNLSGLVVCLVNRV